MEGLESSWTLKDFTGISGPHLLPSPGGNTEKDSSYPGKHQALGKPGGYMPNLVVRYVPSTQLPPRIPGAFLYA